MKLSALTHLTGSKTRLSEPTRLVLDSLTWQNRLTIPSVVTYVPPVLWISIPPTYTLNYTLSSKHLLVDSDISEFSFYIRPDYMAHMAMVIAIV